MRYLILTLSLVTLTVLYGQSPYQLFRPGVNYLYENLYFEQHRNSPYLLVRADSLGCFEQPPVLKPQVSAWLLEEDYCYRSWPAFIGRQICQTETVTTFAGLRNDLNPTREHQLEIHQQAPAGSRWFAGTVSNFEGTDSIYARVDDVRWESLASGPDSVKYIVLSQSSFGSSLDIASLRISRLGGLLTGNDLNYPYEISSYPQVGRYDPFDETANWGIAFPHVEAIYAQQIGDERHLTETEEFNHGGSRYWENTERQQQLIAQWQDEDQIRWQVWDSRDRSYQYGDGAPRRDTLYRRWQDTLWIDLRWWGDQPVLAGSIHSVWEDELPAQAVWSWEEETTADLCQQLRLIRLQSFLGTESCVPAPVIHSDPNPWYYNRFGGPFHFSLYATGRLSSKLLVYYRTAAGETCGTPYDFVVQAQDIPPPAAGLQLYPNPVRDLLHWRLPASAAADGRIQLLNAQGQVLGQQAAAVGQWDTSALPRGVYWLRWQTRDKQTHLQSFLKN